MFGFGPMSGWYGEDLETGRGRGGGGGGGSGKELNGCSIFMLFMVVAAFLIMVFGEDSTTKYKREREEEARRAGRGGESEVRRRTDCQFSGTIDRRIRKRVYSPKSPGNAAILCAIPNSVHTACRIELDALSVAYLGRKPESPRSLHE